MKILLLVMIVKTQYKNVLVFVLSVENVISVNVD